MDEAKIASLMKSLDLTREEAIQLMEDDKATDKGADLNPLTAEQEKVSKSMRRADRKPFVPKFTKRERKPNELKREIIDDLFGFICENWPESAKTADISNIERQIDFTIKDISFSVTLTQHRKPKE